MNRRSFLKRAGFAGAGAFGAFLVPITRAQGPSLSPGPNGQIALGAPANQLDVAFEDLTAAHWGEGHDAIATILAAAQSQDAVVQAEVERRFIALLEGPSTQAAKRFACAQLARIGGEGSVATLAAIHCSTGIGDATNTELEKEYTGYLGGIWSPAFSGLDILQIQNRQLEPTHHLSYGNTLGHFHDNFWISSFRRQLVNGILWTAHVDVPINGAPCVITPEDMVLENPDP